MTAGVIAAPAIEAGEAAVLFPPVRPTLSAGRCPRSAPQRRGYACVARQGLAPLCGRSGSSACRPRSGPAEKPPMTHSLRLWVSSSALGGLIALVLVGAVGLAASLLAISRLKRAAVLRDA